MGRPRVFADIAHLPAEQYDREAARRHSRNWRDAQGLDYLSKYARRKKYGLTPEQFAAMVEEQQARCLICRKKKKLFVDHCHETKRVRGLLCMKCNTGIGMLMDAPELVERALDYLKTR